MRFLRNNRAVRYLLVPVFLVLLFMGGRLAYGLISINSPQDRCEFGTGSTELYRQMRDEARAYLREHGKARPPFDPWKGADAFNRKLHEQLSAFAKSRPTMAEKVAAAHALLRQYNMNIRISYPTNEKQYNESKFKRGVYNYQLYRYEFPIETVNPFCVKCYISPSAMYTVKIFENYDLDHSEQVFPIHPWRYLRSNRQHDALDCPVIWKEAS